MMIVPALWGTPSAPRFTDMKPLQAWATVSLHGRSRYGPVCPNPLTDT